MFMEQSVWAGASVDIDSFKVLERYTDTSFAHTLEGAQIFFGHMNCCHLFA